MRKLEINIPMLVPRELTLNKPRGVPLFVVTAIKKDVQVATYYAAFEAMNKFHPWIALKAATVNYTFYVPDKRYIKDDDNVISGAKYMLDVLQQRTKTGTGLRAGIIINDKNVKIGNVAWVVDKENPPHTIIEVVEREGNAK